MDGILQHFRKEEQPFIEMAMDWAREVEDLYSPKLTDYLDPRQRFIVESVVKGSGLLVAEDGGFESAERKRMLIYPDYYEPTRDDFQNVIFDVRYATKFLTLEHPTVLGALMGLGLDRAKFGDIRLKDGDVQLASVMELSTYLTTNFTSAGKAKIHLTELPDREEWITLEEVWVEETQIISSLRLDTVIAALLNVARQKSAANIHGGKVKVNWREVDQPSFELNESDILSIRGHGRFKIIAIEGRTKKDKIRLVTGKLE
ncbi:RNA-binding protein [Sporosarcina sp. BI001-red]|uniref:YlmH family RNA-binding protein n=1 Tax=Sporosarcina sp. BI001-red TaxID=2282866 RepID=UPI000E27538B|nr:YlmH/Sll1252 family protein [Sporosarcina sp. BI001-red]REB09689.1 RNA-binding protein [Sporosarcina sp. BI001-red]